MEKVVILVEDELYPLEEVLLNIQSILFIASKNKITNAPGKKDTEICVLQVLEKNQLDEEENFLRLKRILETREQDMREVRGESIPEIAYEYKSVQIDKQTYPDNCEECKEIICDKIEEIRAGRECAIILDVVLAKGKDTKIVLEGEKKILSQLLYETLRERCIPYTHYVTEGVRFTQMWVEKVQPCEKAYDRENIEGNIIYKPYRDEIYGKLKIGEISDERV